MGGGGLRAGLPPLEAPRHVPGTQPPFSGAVVKSLALSYFFFVI